VAEQTEILSQWYRHFEGLSQSVDQFYASVEAAVKRRSIPEVKFDRVNLKEGGLLSASREYLRIKRGDLRYDICGAPFGNGFFVSSRLFAEGKFADSLLGDMGRGGMLSQIAGAVAAKAVGADTYYKLDTAQMFLQLAHNGLLEAVDAMTSAASLPKLPDADRRPILKGFFQ